MRFGKRSRNWAISARRDVTDPNEGVLGPVASEERHALLSREAETETDDVSLPPEDDALLAGNPRQRLATALGRFHRYVVKGQAGAAQTYWSDDCMNQLAAAIEIALSQNWMNIVESLTDIARVLQSYENASCAHLCLPFLGDSYEILSLMVTDLSTNRVSTGLIERWRKRYQSAVEELTTAGLTLVQDEEEGAAHPAADAAEAAPTAREEVEQATFLPFLDAGEEEKPLKPIPEASEAVTAAAKPKERAADPEVVRVLDALCEDLSILDGSTPAERQRRLEVIVEKVAWLEWHAEADQQAAPKEVCEKMSGICRAAIRAGTIPEDRFLDTAYAFCETYVEAGKDPGSAAVRSWCNDADALLSHCPAPEAPEEAPIDPPLEAGADASAEMLLETAQQAVARGDVSGAKTLALQAVARMAQAETAKAEARVAEAELKLKESGEAIDRGRGQVKKAEQDVALAESRVTDGETELAESRSDVAKALERTAGVEKRIAEIEEQIRALQNARNAEETRLQEAGGDLHQAREEELRADAEMRAFQAAEDNARLVLENARQQVKDLQRRRSELETSLSHGRETLMRHRASLADIERTVGQAQPQAEETPPEKGDMLF